jgi:hypothetical protein
MISASDVVARAAWGADLADDYRADAAVLLRDFCACVAGLPAPGRSAPWPDDGRVGLVGSLAMRAHAADRDDLDWATLTHPGSVVWAVVLGMGAAGLSALRAAAAGYEAGRAVAELLAGSRAHWHATAVAGHAAAAMAAATILELDRERACAAVTLALSVAGGLSSTTREPAAGMWHRAAAAMTGVQAAGAAQAGITAPGDVLDGPQGFAEAFALARPADLAAAGRSSRPAISQASVRLYATNGFLQSVVHAAAALGREVGAQPDHVRVTVASAVASATDRDPGRQPWWSLRYAVAVALATGDEWALEQGRVSGEPCRRGLLDVIEVVAGSGAPYAAVVEAAGTRIEVTRPPGERPGDSVAELERKWQALGSAELSADAVGRILAGDRLVGRDLLRT